MIKKNKDMLLLDQVNPACVGIIWLTKGPLTERPRPFDGLNYLFDGLLAKYQSDSLKTDLSKNLFMGKSFGRPFFLGHVQENESQVIEDVKSIMNLALNSSDERKEVLIISEDKKIPDQIIKSLKKDFSHFSFSHMAITQ